MIWALWKREKARFLHCLYQRLVTNSSRDCSSRRSNVYWVPDEGLLSNNNRSYDIVTELPHTIKS